MKIFFRHQDLPKGGPFDNPNFFEELRKKLEEYVGGSTVLIGEKFRKDGVEIEYYLTAVNKLQEENE